MQKSRYDKRPLDPIFVASFPCRIAYTERFLKIVFKICPQFCPTPSSIRAWFAIKLLIFVLRREYIVHEIEPEFWNMVENLVSRSAIYQSFGNFMSNTNFDVIISNSVMFGLHFIQSNMVSVLFFKKRIKFQGQATSPMEWLLSQCFWKIN